jgi:gluconate 2-dehydrogenase subunit 3-like protein
LPSTEVLTLRGGTEGDFKQPVLNPAPARSGLFTGGTTRRRLLKVTGVSGLALLAGSWLYRTFWRLGAPAPGCVCFTPEELLVAGAIAEVFFPGPPQVPYSAAEVKLAEFADAFVGGQYEDNQHLIKLVLRTVERWPVLRSGRRFSQLALADRKIVLDDFRDSGWMVKGAAYESLRYLFSLGYFEDMRVRRAAGLKFGCDLSSRFPPLPEDRGG